MDLTLRLYLMGLMNVSCLFIEILISVAENPQRKDETGKSIEIELESYFYAHGRRTAEWCTRSSRML